MKWKTYIQDYLCSITKTSLLMIWLFYYLILSGFIDFNTNSDKISILSSIYFYLADYHILIFIIMISVIPCFKASYYLKSCYFVLTVLSFIVFKYLLYIIDTSIYSCSESATVEVNGLEVNELILTRFNGEANTMMIFALLIFGLLIIFNIHYILSLKDNYIPMFNRDLGEAYRSRITLNYLNLLIILILILSPVFFIIAPIKFDNIYISYGLFLVGNLSSIDKLISFFILLYFLELISLLTLSIHIWLNLSIVYSFYKILITKNCVDLRDRNKYRLLRRFTSFLSMTSNRYLLLLFLLLVAYVKITYNEPIDAKDHNIYYSLSGFFEVEPLILSILFILLISINLILYLHVLFIARDFVYSRYGRIQTHSSSLLEDDVIKIKKIVEPFSPRNHIMIFLSLLTSITYAATSIIINYYIK